MARQKWEQILGALFQGAQSVLPMYFAYMQQQEDEMAQREEEKKGQLEQDRLMELITSIVSPEQIATEFAPGKGPAGSQASAYAMPGVVEGGTPVYPEDRTPTEGFLRLLEGAQSGDIGTDELQTLLYYLNTVGGGMYEPVAPEEPPESVNMQEMADVISLLRGDMGVSFLPGGGGALDELQRATGLDYSQEIPAYLANPEMWNLQFPVPEEHPAEIDPFTLSPGSVRYIQDAEGNLVPIVNPSRPSIGSAVSTTSPGWVSPEGFTPNPWYMEPEAGLELTPSQLQMDCSAWMTYRIKNTVNPEVDRFTTRSLVDNPQAYGATQVAGPLQPGDLVVWHTGAGPNGMHVGMAVLDENGNMVVENKSEGTPVRYQDIDPTTGMRSGGVQGETVVGMYRFSTAAAPRARTTAELEDQFWNGLTPQLIAERVNAAGGFAVVNEDGSLTMDEPPQGMDYLYRQYDQELNQTQTGGNESTPSDNPGPTRIAFLTDKMLEAHNLDPQRTVDSIIDAWLQAGIITEAEASILRSTEGWGD